MIIAYHLYFPLWGGFSHEPISEKGTYEMLELGQCDNEVPVSLNNANSLSLR